MWWLPALVWAEVGGGVWGCWLSCEIVRPAEVVARRACQTQVGEALDHASYMCARCKLNPRRHGGERRARKTAHAPTKRVITLTRTQTQHSRESRRTPSRTAGSQPRGGSRSKLCQRNRRCRHRQPIAHGLRGAALNHGRGTIVHAQAPACVQINQTHKCRVRLQWEPGVQVFVKGTPAQPGIVSRLLSASALTSASHTFQRGRSAGRVRP